MTRAGALAWVCGLVVFVAPAMARAQRADDTAGPAGEAPTPSADEMFREATLAVAEGRFARARDLLERILALDPSPAIAFNLAVAYRGTGQLRRAVGLFEALLDGRHGTLDDARRAQVRTLAREVEAQLGHLTIHLPADVSGVELRVDGSEIDTAGPAVTLTVDPGTHIVTVAAPDHRTEEQRVDVGQGASVEVRPRLVPRRDDRPGTLVLASESADAEIEIVGVARGRGRIERQLDPGTYQVRLLGDGGAERVASVRVPPGRTVRMTLMAPEGSVWKSPWLWLTVGLLVAGGAAAVAALALSDRTEPPLEFPPIPVVEALRIP